MKLIAAFFRLIRWQNLFFIALTQVLFQFCIYQRIYSVELRSGNDEKSFWFLVVASVLIASAGYIINDYFDLNIDAINKPDKVVVNNIISRRWVIIWHLLLSLVGVYLTFHALSFHLFWHIMLANLVCVLLLWFYSTTLKKKLLIGNLLISALTAWVIFIIFLSKFGLNNVHHLEHKDLYARFLRLTILYAGFAFIISLIREVIKDMEDIEGDRNFGCRTMPILWGLNASKVFVAVWLIVLIITLVILQLYVIQFSWWASIAYCFVLIVVPLLYVFKKLFAARNAKDFHQLSTYVKLIMLTGILSMVFFKIYS